MAVGKSVKRVDAYEKVSGRARYTDDFTDENTLVAKIAHSKITNGWVRSIGTAEAAAVPGVVKIVTCFDTPDIQFASAGHPWVLDPAGRDIADRKLLNSRVRQYGDDIAAVIATTELAASKAVRLLKVEYEELPPVLTPDQAQQPGLTPIHEEFPDNIVCSSCFQDGEPDRVFAEDGVTVFEESYTTPRVSHCHLENTASLAYMEAGRIVIVTSTQIPHIIRRIVAQALGISWGQVRVIKPYVGGGFGNKQDAHYEPLNAFLTTQVGGRKVKLELTREETFMCTRSRHAISFRLKTAVDGDGRFVGRYVRAVADSGAYASHGHIVVGNSINIFRDLYPYAGNARGEALTVYTNLGTSGAMRGYGIPQVIFAMEAHMDDLALKLNMDPVEIRLKNVMRQGYVDPHSGLTCHSNGVVECIEKGKSRIRWDDKRRLYTNQSSPVRRGIGMSLFCYKTGVYPFCLEIAGARLVLNEDGSAQLQVGATEIGQGTDTVLTQMAAETTGLLFEDIHIVSTQDTDVSPFDNGAYASRQTYVTGMAVKKTSELFRSRILEHASVVLDLPASSLELRGRDIIDSATGSVLIGLGAVAEDAFYHLKRSAPITAECTHSYQDNTFAFGATFAEVEVDLRYGKISVLNMINVHDSGRIINPELALGQAHGGMSMSLGFGTTERLIYDDGGRLLNGNLLDYKLPTAMDSPEFEAAFVETEDPSGPYGNKSLGEPTTISPAAAIRNAVLQATGVAFNDLPLHPEKLIMTFKARGLI
jgi:xanthine dehydrogenase molybdenum-binding subunit